MKTITVVGLGKLGAPMAAVFAARGHKVIGVDVNASFVDALNEGLAPVNEPRLQAMIDEGRSRLRATTDFAEAIPASDASFVIVPTPSDHDHFFTNRYVVEAMEKIGAALRSRSGYHVVVVTSTVMPGSTGGMIRETLERASGFKVGEDIGLCYGPEFIALGSVINDMLRPDLLLIGESDARAGSFIEAIYREVVETKPEIHRMNFVNAELCKIAVNTFVTTKISYANMIAEMCDRLPGADAELVTKAVGADSRIGRKYLRGAIGYGGPCFPRDNKAFGALGKRLGVRCDLAEATDRINDHQLERLFQFVEHHAGPAAKVAILGMSYKPHTEVIEESQGVALAHLLSKRGYAVTVFDPQSGDKVAALLGNLVERAPSAAEAVARADVVVITTPWPEFNHISFTPQAKRCELVVIDPWRVVDQSKLGDGVTYILPGRGNRGPAASIEVVQKIA